MLQYPKRNILVPIPKKGVDPLMLPVNFLSEKELSYFENNGEKLSEMMNAPILLIDDLGTEPMLQNITIEQLFNLLNERQLNRRHTVISTNLTMTELKERYNERIASRLLDDASWRRLTLTGNDVRKKLKRGAAKA